MMDVREAHRRCKYDKELLTLRYEPCWSVGSLWQPHGVSFELH